MPERENCSVLIPLVEPVGEKFALSKPLLKVVGTLGWGRNLWEVRAFVARVITHLEDGYEHFLDNDDDDDSGLFHVSTTFCKFLAERFRDEFLPLPTEWYHKVALAKLESLRVPVGLVEEAKLAWFLKNHNATVFARGLLELPKLKGVVLTSDTMDRVAEAAVAPAEKSWTVLEDIASLLERQGVLTDDELCTLMDLDTEIEFEEFLGRYRTYLGKSGLLP